MGGVYQDIVKKVQGELNEMPASLDQEIPIY